MDIFLTLLSGIGWMIVYEECIRLGFKDKTYSMPFFVLGLNFAWEVLNFAGELIFHWHGVMEGLTLAQTIVNGLWAGFDILILYTYIKYGKKEWCKNAPEKWFLPWTVIGLICCFTLQLLFIVEFGGVKGAEYSAFLQNVLMSILFIDLYWKRGNMEGQSMLLAVAKWIGTIAPTILMGVITFNPFIIVCGIFCSIFDLIYIYLLATHKKGVKHYE